MRLMNLKPVLVGFCFGIENPTLGLSLKGDVRSLCAEIEARGFAQNDVWSAATSQITRFPVAIGMAGAMGKSATQSVAKLMDVTRADPSVRLAPALWNAAKAGELSWSSLLRLWSIIGLGSLCDHLLSSGLCDVDASEFHGMSPLCWACAYGQEPMVDLLMKHNASLMVCNIYQAGLTDLARLNRHIALSDRLQSLGAPVPGSSLNGYLRERGVRFKGDIVSGER